MNKSAMIKSGLISAMLVAMVCAVVIPAVSASTQFWAQNATNHYGEGVGAGGSADRVGSYWTNNIWHVGRWLGTCQSYSGNLYFTLYANGQGMSSNTPNTYYDASSGSSLTSLGSYAYSYFYDSRVGTFYYTAGYVGLA